MQRAMHNQIKIATIGTVLYYLFPLFLIISSLDNPYTLAALTTWSSVFTLLGLYLTISALSFTPPSADITLKPLALNVLVLILAGLLLFDMPVFYYLFVFIASVIISATLLLKTHKILKAYTDTLLKEKLLEEKSLLNDKAIKDQRNFGPLLKLTPLPVLLLILLSGPTFEADVFITILIYFASLALVTMITVRMFNAGVIKKDLLIQFLISSSLIFIIAVILPNHYSDYDLPLTGRVILTSFIVFPQTSLMLKATIRFNRFALLKKLTSEKE